MNYPYANGVITALDDKVINKSKFSKLIKLEKGEFLKTLVDFGYGKNAKDKSDLESIIKSELNDTKNMFDSISPNRKFTDLFYLSNDALNIKVLWKMKIFDTNHQSILVDSGKVIKDAYVKAILNDDYSLLDLKIEKLLKEIDSKVSSLENPRLISATIDNLIYNYIFSNITITTNNAIKVYFDTLIDFSNIKSMIRSLKLNWNIDKYLEMFLDNGMISKDDFINAYSVSNDEIIRIFKKYYNEKLSVGIKNYFDTNNLSKLELYFDGLLIDIMKQYRNDSLNIGPIIYYYIKKEAEAKNIRAIYANKDIELNDLLEY